MSVGIVGVLSSSVQLQSIDLLLLSFVLLFLFLSHRSVWNLKSVPRPVTFWAKFLNYTIALTSHLQTTKQQLILSLFTFCKPSLSGESTTYRSFGLKKLRRWLMNQDCNSKLKLIGNQKSFLQRTHSTHRPRGLAREYYDTDNKTNEWKTKEID